MCKCFPSVRKYSWIIGPGDVANFLRFQKKLNFSRIPGSVKYANVVKLFAQYRVQKYITQRRFPLASKIYQREKKILFNSDF